MSRVHHRKRGCMNHVGGVTDLSGNNVRYCSVDVAREVELRKLEAAAGDCQTLDCGTIAVTRGDRSNYRRARPQLRSGKRSTGEWAKHIVITGSKGGGNGHCAETSAGRYGK